MFCRYCGHQVPDGAKFCSKCGKKLADTDSASRTGSREETQRKPGQKSGLLEFVRGHKAVTAAACVLFVLVCAFAYDILDTNAKQAAWDARTTGTSQGSGKKRETSSSASASVQKTVDAADPTCFFGVDPDSEEDTGDSLELTYTLDLNHTVFDEYREVLVTHYDLEETEVEKSVSTERYSYTKDEAKIMLKADFNHSKGNMVVTMLCNELICLEDSGVEPSKSVALKPSSSGSSKPSSSSGSSQASGGKVSRSSTAVPDMGLFLGGFGRTNDDPASTEIYAYSLDDTKGMKAVDEYRELLTGSYNFKEAASKVQDFTDVSKQGLICYTYYYKYTGSASVGSKEWSSASQESNLYLLVNHYTAEDRIGVTLHLGSGLAVENSGKKASDPPKDMSGNGSGGGSDSVSGSGGVNIPEFAKKDCPICKGTKKCQTCKGRGYLYSRASGKYDRNCTDCYNCSGKCRYCNGTGKQQ